MAEESDGLVILAVLANERGDVEGQFRRVEELLELGKRYLPARLRGLNFYTAALRNQGRTTEAIRHGRIALRELDAAISSGEEFPLTLRYQIPYNFGKALADAGEHSEGITLLERAREAAELQGALGGIWHVLHDTGEIYALTGDVEAATRYYLRALEVARRIDSRDPEGVTLRGLGAVAESHGDLESALRYYNESLRLFERAGDEAELPHTLVSLSRAQWRAGERTEAAASLRRAVSLARRAKKYSGLTLAHLEEARQREEEGQLPEAEDQYRRALEIARDNGLQIHVPAAWNGVAGVARKRGEPAKALEAYAAAADAVDALRATIPSEQQRISFVATTHELYRGWVKTLLALRRVEEAFRVLERERSRNISDAVRASAVPSPNPQLETQIARLQAELASPQLPDERRALLMRDLEDAERRFDLAVSRSGSAGRAVPSLKALQRALRPDETFLAYTSLANEVVIFVVTRDHIRALTRTVSDLESRVVVFNQALQGSRGPEAIGPGAGLTEALIHHLDLNDSTKRLVVAASGDLAALPFAALPDPASRRPLLERFEIAYSPSLSALASLRERVSSAPPFDLLAVAPLGALPATLSEIKGISRLMNRRIDTLVDTTATETSVKQQPLADYQVLHFASHAVLDPRFPSRSGIELAAASGEDDGRLQIREIYRLRLAGQLVVLSACATAAGRTSAAEGMQSIARAFTHAGARTVVGTLWRVEDREAARFVEEMYRRLAAGSTVASALRHAQLATAGNRPYTNAAVWAPWVATGDPAAHALIGDTKRGPDYTILAVAGGFLILAIGYLLTRSRRSYTG